MLSVHLLLIKLLLMVVGPGASTSTPPAESAVDEVGLAYADLGLEGLLARSTFDRAWQRFGEMPEGARYVAIADMTRPSTEKRLHIIDLVACETVLSTWVAHGQNSGDLMAEHFSNRNGSHQTSLGLYRVGAEITSPKHGQALLLHGLDKGVNCQALPREIIIHGADYVGEDFIRQHGRLGRSWGCPAVARDVMPDVAGLLANGGLLYIHGR
jgi:hypothetical protein